MDTDTTVAFTLDDVTQTEHLGAVVGRSMQNGSVIFLKGELGAGKTSLVRGLLRELGYLGPVKSPTYTLLEEYTIDGKEIIHFDLYRLTDPEELDLIGIRDYFSAAACCLVEWPERGEAYLPAADMLITLMHSGSKRQAVVLARSEKGEAILGAIQTEHGQKSG